MPAPTPALEPQDVLEVLHDRDREEYPVMSSHDIHEELERRGFDIGPRTTKYRLSDLHEAGEIRRRKAGNTPVYWLPGDFASLEEGKEEPPDVATSGGVEATGEGEELVKQLNDLREDITQMAREVQGLEKSQEDISETVAQVLNSSTTAGETTEDPITTWGERAAQEAEETFRVVQHAAVGFTLVGVLWVAALVMSPSLLTTSLPVFSQVENLLAFFGVVLLCAVVFGGFLGLLYYGLWRSGLADWGEARFGDTWRGVWAEDRDEPENPAA